MRGTENRLKALEEKLMPKEHRVRIFLLYVPARRRDGKQEKWPAKWTEEEMATAIRDNPETLCFEKDIDGIRPHRIL